MWLHVVMVDSEQHYSGGHSPAGERSRDGPTAMLTATSSTRTEAAAVLLNRKEERSSRYCHRPSEGSGHYSNGCGLGILACVCVCSLITD